MVKDKTVHDRPVVVRRLDYPEDGDQDPKGERIDSLFEELKDAHLVYIDSSREDRVPGILGRLGHDGILTVSDSRRFAARGGMIGLVVQNARIAFEANLDAIDRSRVKVSSKVLRLARVVENEGQ